jgi:hypothetical protein
MGTAAAAVKECGWKYGDSGAGVNRQQTVREARETNGRGRLPSSGENGALEGAHEALPHTPPGGQPPETPAPFPGD